MGEELNAIYNHCLAANGGKSLLLRVNELDYIPILDAIAILCGNQPTYQLRDLPGGEHQPYVANWVGEALSLHINCSCARAKCASNLH